MGRIDIKLKRIERMIEMIDKTNTAKKDSAGQGRTILQNSKTKELKNIYQEIIEAQKLIDEIDCPQMREDYQQELDLLEDWRREKLHPAIVIVYA